MENQKSVFKLCDHEYVINSKGHVTCLSCGLSERKASLFVPEEGYENRTIMRGPLPDELYGIVNNRVFEEDWC